MSEYNQREVFVRNLRYYMESRGIEQADIVASLGITASTVSDWVNGKKYPRVDAMQKLAKMLEVSISDLTIDEGEHKQSYVLDEEEVEFVNIFRKLSRREKTMLMAKVYEFEDRNRHGKGG